MANELRQLVDTANAPIFGIDVHGNVNEWNDKTAEITGFSKEEAFNRPMVSTFIEPKLQESVQTVLDNALHGNETSNYQLEFRTKSNETRYLLVNATTRRDADSNIVGVVGVAQDGQFYSSCLLSIFFRSVLGPSSFPNKCCLFGGSSGTISSIFSSSVLPPSFQLLQQFTLPSL